jgi:hypothetical protein
MRIPSRGLVAANSSPSVGEQRSQGFPPRRDLMIYWYLKGNDSQGLPERPEIMSWVQNIMVSALDADWDNVEMFAGWLRQQPGRYLDQERWGRPEDFEPANIDTRTWPYSGDLRESPQEVWPGPKHHECNVWLGVLDGADLDRVRAYFASIKWRVPNAVQLFMMDQEELFFRAWMFREGRLQQYSANQLDENDDGFWGDYDIRRHGVERWQTEQGGE